MSVAVVSYTKIQLSEFVLDSYSHISRPTFLYSCLPPPALVVEVVPRLRQPFQALSSYSLPDTPEMYSPAISSDSQIREELTLPKSCDSDASVAIIACSQLKCA